MSFKVAIIGADFFVSQELMRILEEREFPYEKIFALQTTEAELFFSLEDNNKLIIQKITDFDFQDADIIFIMDHDNLPSNFFANLIKEQIVIDCTQNFNLNDEICLCVPEINIDHEQYQQTNHNIIFANPNPLAIQMSTIIHAIAKNNHIKRINFTALKATAHEGDQGMNELFEQTKSVFEPQLKNSQIYEKQIAFNCWPKVGHINSCGFTDIEIQITKELKKILPAITFNISGTVVQAPLFRSDSIIWNIEYAEDFDIENFLDHLENNESILIMQDSMELDQKIENFASSMDSDKEDSVFISRIRQDKSLKHGVSFWTTMDCLRKGCALNAVQIAEKLLKISD